MNLDKKTIVLTGASGGLGQELARQLASTGAQLVLVGNTAESLARIALELDGTDSQHFTLDLDLGTEKGIDTLIEFCQGLPAGIDVLINGAGLNHFALTENHDTGFTRQLFMVNLVAPVLLTVKLLPQLREKNEALIVNIGSVLGAIGSPGYAPYCASKSGLMRFSESLRRELADSSINVLQLNPRVIQTAMNTEITNRLNEQLSNKSDTPKFVARLLVRKIQRNRFGEINIGWPERLFVKINAVFPSLVDKNFRKTLPMFKKAAGMCGKNLFTNSAESRISQDTSLPTRR